MTNAIKNIFKPIDLTTGKPWKKMLIFMIPVMLSYIFQNIYTLSDAAIVGNSLSAAEVSGVNVVYSLIYIVLQFAIGCASGFSVASANCVGEKDENGLRKSFATQLILSVIIGIVLTILATVLEPYLLQILNILPTDSNYQYAHDYLLVIYLGLSAQILYNFIVSFLRSIGDSFTPLLFLIASTCLNIGLDFLCILVFKWGVIGAAGATVFSQGVSFVGCFIYSLIKYPHLRLSIKDFKISMNDILIHLKLGLPLAFQFSILAIGLITLQRGMVRIDEYQGNLAGIEIYDAVLAYGAATNLVNFLMVPLMSLGVALLSFSGQCHGANDLERLRKGIKESIIMMLIMYGIILVLALLLSINGWFTNFFLGDENNNDRVKFYATTYVLIDVSMFFILGFLFIGRNVYQGVGKVLFPFLAGVGELIARVLVSEFLPSIVNPTAPGSDISFIALCFSDSIAWLFACLIFAVGLIYFSKRGNLFASKKGGKPNINKAFNH